MNGSENGKRKLLFFHHYGLIGGAGLSGAEVLQAIPKESYDITVCCSTAAGRQMFEFYRSLGVSMIDGGKTPWGYIHYSGNETPLLSRRSIQMLLPVLRDRSRVRSILERERPDLVVVNSMALFWIGPIAKSLGMHTVCFFRETYAKEWLGIRNAIIRRTLAEHFDAIAFISENDLRQNPNAKGERIVICDSVDIDRLSATDRSAARERLGLCGGKKYLLYVGGTSKLKGAHVALETMLQLQDSDAVLLFVGANALLREEKPQGIANLLRWLLHLPYVRRLRHMANRLTARGQLLLFPLQKDIIPFYAAADALIAPSTKPHQLRPIYEAGAARIPVITTRFDAIAEFADDARAYLVDPDDVSGFANTVRQALFSPDADRICENFKSVSQKNSKQSVAAQCRALFDRLYHRMNETTEAVQ